jgi:DNA primase
MAGRIPQSFIDELLSRTDVVEIIGSRVPLKRAGKEWKACCPFHGEKTPSFTVSQSKQFYHCFGCGAHGTALTFLMEHDRLSFPEAIEDLAQRAGLEVPREGGIPRDTHHDELYALMAQVEHHYREALRESPRAQDYLKGRGLTGETAARFHLGYAPASWDGVLRRFGSTEAGRQALLTCGLIIERSEPGQSGHYDRFRDRIMFPIRDSRGRILGFGGRILDHGEPKYLNSPETPLFHKGRELYGLFEARAAVRQLTRLLIVEGYMDAARLSQSGIQYVVATLGTATTPEHLNRLFRVTSDLIFAFDGDRAGRQAAWRALEICLPYAKEGRQLKFLFLPDGHDPDTLVAEEGPEAFETRVDAAQPLSEYLVGHLAAQVDLSSVDGRARLAELARPLVARIPDGVYRELLIDRLASEVRMPGPRLAALLGLAAEAPLPRGRSLRPADLGGRVPLVSQAIARVLQQPEAAAGIAEVAPLAESGERGLQVLAELITSARAEPGLSTAQLIERWRERPEYERLAELAAVTLPELDGGAVARELAAAIGKLLEGLGPGRRIDALIAKAEADGLSDSEKAELQALQARRRPDPARH